MSLQASLRAAGCLIASFATRMTLSSEVVAMSKSEIRNPELVTKDFGEPKLSGKKSKTLASELAGVFFLTRLIRK